MAGLTIRNPLNILSNLRVGSSGTAVTKILMGTVSACVPAMNASTPGTGSANITGLAQGDAIIMQLASYGASGIGIISCSAVAANTASLSFMAVAGATTASTMTFNYLAMDS